MNFHNIKSARRFVTIYNEEVDRYNLELSTTNKEVNDAILAVRQNILNCGLFDRDNKIRFNADVNELSKTIKPKLSHVRYDIVAGHDTATESILNRDAEFLSIVIKMREILSTKDRQQANLIITIPDNIIHDNIVERLLKT